MFQRARLRLTILYVSLMGVTLALVAGGIFWLGAEQTRRAEDQSLRLRAESIAGFMRPGDGRVVIAAFDREAALGARPGGPPPPRLEGEGIIVYPLDVQDNLVVERRPANPIAGLPDLASAQAAVDAGDGRFQTLSLEAGEVRVYNLPVVVNDQTTSVVQVVRSRYFVDSTVTRLILIILGAGALGLLFSAGASFWLSGRTLRPIATALQRQRDFAADASHELRTPLSLVRGNAELLLRHPERQIGAYGDVVQDIVDESDRLSKLVSDLLTLARADSGNVQIAREAVDLSRLAADLLKDLEPLAQVKGLRLRGEIAGDVAVWGDAGRLRQLGVILLDNAIRYTQQGTVTLRVARDGHTAVIELTDTGPGIAAEHLPRLFDRFYRVDEARSTEQGGTGLGLAIAQWIVTAHGGRIGVMSTPGRGSTFTVHLPPVRGGGVGSPAPEDGLPEAQDDVPPSGAAVLPRDR
ncbi:MAG: sensor histidine kinase [Dehalococcoidia bacterium]